MTTQRITFTEWTPDQPSIVENLSVARNVIPSSIGFNPFPLALDYSTSASEDLNNAITGRFSSTSITFAGGATKLFKLDGSTLALADVSKAGGYSNVVRWNFTQFGDTVICANDRNKLQAWTLGSSTLFADLAAAAPIAKYVTVVRDFVVCANLDTGTYSNKVQWSNINDETNWTAGAASQSDFQIIPDGGNITGITGGEFGLVLMERGIVRMSYIGSPLFFQFDTISRNLGCREGNSVTKYGNTTYFLSNEGFYSCDGQSVKAIGNQKIDNWFYTYVDPTSFDVMSATVDPVLKIVVWNFKTLASSIYAGGRLLLIYNWQVDKWSYAETDVDFISNSSSIATAGATLESLDTTYAIAVTAIANATTISTSGFIVGNEYMIKTMGTTTSANWNTLAGTSGVTYVVGSTFIAAGTTVIGTGTAYLGKRYSIVSLGSTTNANWNTIAGTSGVTYAAGNNIYSILTGTGTGTVVSLDLIPITMDSQQYAGGSLLFSGLRDAKIITFSKTISNANSQIITGDIGSEYNSTVILARPIVDNGSASVAVSSRTLLSGTVTFSADVPATSENRVSLRSNGKYHKFSVKPTGTNWTNIIAIDVDIIPQGTR